MACSQQGFSLIEILVAFLVTALSLGIIFQIYAKGAAATVLADEYTHALAIAESKLAGASVYDRAYDFEEQGREADKFDWEIRTEEYVNEAQITDFPASYALMSVDVNVSWQGRGKLRQVNLQTLKPVSSQ